MPTLNSSDRLTAVELIKRGGVNADQRRIIEELSTINEMLLDAAVAEANDGTINTQLVRTANPHGTHVVYNQGVAPSASQTKTIHDVICMLEAYSEIDCRLADHAVNREEFISNECVSFIHGMAEDQCEDIIYGDHDLDAARMDGLAKRRSKIGELCLNAGGSSNGHMTSIYLVKWGQQFAKYIYPRGAKGMGVNREERGIQDVDVFDASGNRTGKMKAIVNHFSAQYGLAIGHERSLVRIANVDPATITSDNLAKIIIQASAKLAPGDGTVSLLCNQDVKTLFDIAALTKNNVIYNAEDPWGREITKFRDMRIRRCDAIISEESTVS